MIRVNTKLTQFSMISFLIVSLMGIQGYSVSADADMDMPGTLYASGTITYDSSAAPDVIRDSPFQTGFLLDGRQWFKEDGLVTVEVSAALKAPQLLGYTAQPSEYNIVMDGNDSIPDEQPAFPPDETHSQHDFGLSCLIGKKDYVVENATNNVDLVAEDITDNSLISASHYFLLEGAHTIDTASNSTVKVSFATAAAGNITDPAICTNVTVFEGLMIRSMSYWWNLNLENTNDSLTHVINIYVDNVNVDGFFSFDLETTVEVKDLRYESLFLGASRTEYAAAAGIPEYTVFSSDTPRTIYSPQSPSLASILDDFSVSDFTSIPPDMLATVTDLFINAIGWDDVSDLEDDIMDAFAVDANIGIADVLDYDIDFGVFDWLISSDLCNSAFSVLEDAFDLTSDLATAMTDASSDSIQTVSVSTGIEASKIGESGIVTSDETTDVSSGFWATVKENAGKIGSFAVDVKDKIVNAAGNINNNLVSVISSTFEVNEETAQMIVYALIGLGLFALIGAVWYFKIRK